jgi:hypothetical protein
MDRSPHIALATGTFFGTTYLVSLGCGGVEAATTPGPDAGDAASSLDASSVDAFSLDTAFPLDTSSRDAAPPLDAASSFQDACSGGPASGGVADASCACTFAWMQSTGVTQCGCADGGCVCACPEPAGWAGASTAGPCSPPSPFNQSCASEWDECIETLDGGPGSTGCVCLRNPEIDQLTWECGPTNGWFSPSP